MDAQGRRGGRRPPRCVTVSRSHSGAMARAPTVLRQKIAAKAPSASAAAFIVPSITLKLARPARVIRMGKRGAGHAWHRP
jgi:hypothetical protein